MKKPRECAQQRTKCSLQTRGSERPACASPITTFTNPSPAWLLPSTCPKKRPVSCSNSPQRQLPLALPHPGLVRLKAVHASRNIPHDLVTVDSLALGQRTMTSLGRPLILIMK